MDVEAHTQYSQSVNVWAGIDCESYRNFFDVFPAFATLYPNEEHPDAYAQDLWFEQDGASQILVVTCLFEMCFREGGLNKDGTLNVSLVLQI